MPLTAPLFRLLAALVACLALPASFVVRAEQAGQSVQAPQVQPPTESQLRALVAQNPTEAVLYLDLARLYIEQGRLEDAVTMLSNALALTRQAQAASQPGARRPAASDTSVDYADAIRVGGDISPPRKVTNVPPVYPAEALNARIEGIVILEAVIDEQGRVASTRVLRSIPMLDDAAVDAVSQWEYVPTLLNGQPRSVIMNVTVSFSLGR